MGFEPMVVQFCRLLLWTSQAPPYGPSGEVRTPDPLVPNQMRYQAALHSVKKNYLVGLLGKTNKLSIPPGARELIALAI